MTETATGRIWRAQVTVLPKPGVNDPAGDSIRGGLEQLGYAGVSSVRAGKVVTLAVEADSIEAARTMVERMCDQLLANPVIETYRVAVSSGDAGQEIG